MLAQPVTFLNFNWQGPTSNLGHYDGLVIMWLSSIPPGKFWGSILIWAMTHLIHTSLQGATSSEGFKYYSLMFITGIHRLLYFIIQPVAQTMYKTEQ